MVNGDGDVVITLDAGNLTLTDYSFAVTNATASDGTATFKATATADENPATDNENDLNDNVATAVDSQGVTVAGTPAPTATIGSVGADSIFVKEDRHISKIGKM